MNAEKNQYMKTRVYYGEYTLRHWLNLMLIRNIDLPEYQRSFVWEEEDVKRMLDSLTQGQFILPEGPGGQYLFHGITKSVIINS